MKKYLLLILMIPLLIGWTIDGMDSPTTIDGMTGFSTIDGMIVSTCVKDTVDLVMDESAMSEDSAYSMDSDAVGQSISYGSEWVLYSIEPNFQAATSNCVYTVRIGTSSNLSTYMEEWSSESAPNGGGFDELVSADQDTYSASTTYYIGLVEVSGGCALKQDTTSPPYTGGTLFYKDSGWVLGSGDSNRDYHINVYKCQ